MKTILLLTDFSKKADHAAELAVEVAERAGADILVYNACLVPEVIPAAEAIFWQSETYSIIEDESKALLEKTANRLKKKIASGDKNLYKPEVNYFCDFGTVADTIASVVQKNQVWLVVMGTKGDNGISNFLFGSNAYGAIDNASCPVLLIPEKTDIADIKKVALATDLQLEDMKQVDFLAEFARLFKSEVVVTHVSPKGVTSEEEHQQIIDLVNRLNNSTASFKGISGDEIEKKLEEFSVSEHVDILAVVHRKYNLLERIFHSSTTKVLIRHSKLPLLVLPG
ncbi:universal stress protein [Desertivirga brevis]|uniref:universal stress protein n=1 Tax=Desertivirga brevis TaxID=2810310 RepID=UPI001A96BEFE|nr:universal stress protein [Pedobacter sp. SYSU D00873]